MTALIAMLLLLTGATGAGVALARRPGRQVMAIAANGFVLAMLFLALQAPDVAFSELTVGAAAVPLLFLVVLASTRMDRSPQVNAPPSDPPPPPASASR
jgi:energy-converting hydrogenase B subunit D